ncbi:MAG: asparagine synthase (glutamine-hydrolyzing) [Myxococcales bacterium]|nr:asparagine synthase (glutamine-hydrolyzing) [Myxococcales bacterium]
MCGIFGVVAAADDALAGVAAERALEAMRLRGPDESGIHREPGVVLGHVRLSILDLTPSGRQPMSTPDGDVTVVFNGEIYDHAERREELRAAGHTFRGRSDTEVILEAYREWGEGCVDRLDGMFAFALWDRKKRRLLLARDRAGKKPLFHAREGGRIWFASEAHALFAAGLPCKPDVTQLSRLFAFGCARAPHTMYENVAQVPPATSLSVAPGGVPTERRFWRAPFTEPPLTVAASEATVEVRHLVERAVERRLVADVPVGAFLSGGIDSTIIVGAAAKAIGKIKTFSIGFEGDPRFDETHFARVAAKAFATEHTEVRLTPSAFKDIEGLVRVHDGPFGDSSALPTALVSSLARGAGMKVALTGDGGDELFCGYVRFLTVEASERIPAILRRAGGIAARRLPQVKRQGSFGGRVQRFLRKAELPLEDRILSWTSYFGFELEELLRPEVRAVSPIDEPMHESRSVGAQRSGATPLARLLEYNFETYLPDDLLVKADRSSMLHSLELRSPFLDTALVEYVARLPDDHKRRGRETKWVLKRAFSDIIPKEIMNRGKLGFGVPLGTWFRRELRGMMLDVFAPGARMYDLLEQRYVEKLLRQHMDGHADHGHNLWLLLTFETWLRALPSRLEVR